MARNRSSIPPYEPTQASKALKLRRAELGKSQADVAFDSEVLTQTTVSELERGKYGPEDLTAARLAALAKGLNWTVAELEEATGLELNLSSSEAIGQFLERRFPGMDWRQDAKDPPGLFDPRTLFHPPANRRREKRPLWPNLAEMIEEKQEKYPALQETRWQQHLNQTRFSGGQEPDAEGWFEMYQAMRRNNVEPEDWPDDQ